MSDRIHQTQQEDIAPHRNEQLQRSTKKEQDSDKIHRRSGVKSTLLVPTLHFKLGSHIGSLFDLGIDHRNTSESLPMMMKHG